jgi:hypothetical protein
VGSAAADRFRGHSRWVVLAAFLISALRIVSRIEGWIKDPLVTVRQPHRLQRLLQRYPLASAGFRSPTPVVQWAIIKR